MLGEMAYQAVILGGLLFILANVLANLATFDGLRAAEPPANPPLVSVLVPARNEERSIEACVGSLLQQDYPHFELLVLDDHSEDRTGEIVRRLFAEFPNVPARLVRGEPLPQDWTGKNFACHQLAQTARGDFLLFTDADTKHAPGTVTAAVAYAQRNRAGLVSAWPRLVTGTLGEKLIVPVILLVGFAFCPLWLQRWIQERPERAKGRDVRGLGVANGQFLFFTRETYDHIGGHAALRSHVVEDVSLGRAVAARMPEGERLFNCDALRFSEVRMYRSFTETWEGFTKNMRAVFDDQRAGFWLFGLMEAACFLGPFINVFRSAGLAWWLVLGQVAIVLLIRLLLAVRFRTSRLGALLHPVGIFLVLLIGFNSWRRATGRGVVWKGRTYKPEI
jgi:chlorobactene glucosyltransferase